MVIRLLGDCEVIAVDSTAVVKIGKTFEHEGKVYDGRDGRIHDGFPLLIATGVTAKGQYAPLLWQRYHHNYLPRESENIIKEKFFDELKQEQAEKQLTSFGERYSIPSERLHLMIGRPESQIHQIAEDISADLIVVGSHGRQGLALILGSTANGVLHGAHCDVLAVRVGE